MLNQDQESQDQLLRVSTLARTMADTIEESTGEIDRETVVAALRQIGGILDSFAGQILSDRGLSVALSNALAHARSVQSQVGYAYQMPWPGLESSGWDWGPFVPADDPYLEVHASGQVLINCDGCMAIAAERAEKGDG